MKSKTLSKVTWYVFLLIIFSISIMSTDLGNYFPKELNWLIPGMFFCLFFLIAMRVTSYFAINDSHKGISISSLEFTYRTNYFLLTVEAKKVLQDCIAAEQDRLNKKQI